MKSFFRKMKTQNIILILGILIPFLIIVFCYARYSTELNDILVGGGPIATRLRNNATTFALTSMIIYIILMLFLILLEILQNYEKDCLYNTVLNLRNRYDLVFHVFSDSLWEFDIREDSLVKSNPLRFGPTNNDVVHDYRTKALSSAQLHPEDREAFLQFYDHMISRDDIPLHAELRIRNENNEYYWCRIIGQKIFDQDGNPISVIGSTTDISSEKRAEEARQEMAYQDTLTHLPKYEGCEQQITQYFKQLDYAAICAMYLIDLDDFTKITQQYGRVFGDAVLLDFSARLRKKFRSQDILGRIGYDTFLVFVTDIRSMAEIEACANDLCTMLHELYSSESSSIAIRASVGVSVFPTNGNQFNDLYQHATQALYRAKHLGKDRYYIFDNVLEETSADVPDFRDLYTNTTESLSYAENSLINTGMITNAIEILFNAYDNDMSIQMLLSLIGAYYNLDRLCIWQNNPVTKAVSVTHEWVSNPRYQLREHLQQLTGEDRNRYAYYKNSKNGVYYADSILPDEQTALRDLVFLDSQPHALFQCGISERGNDLGSITATIFDTSHTWSKSEIDSLTLISKLIGSHIARSRSLQHADWITRTDQLTHAYNFNPFLSEITKLHKSHPEQPLAMLYSDVYQFKLLNENHGYQVGDFVLQSLANIFREVCPDGILCRIAGDKFALCIPDTGEEVLAQTAKQLISRARQLRGKAGEDFKLSLAIGIYQMKHNDSSVIALDRANIARKNAQDDNLTKFAFYNDDMQASLLRQKNIEDSMEDSLLRNAFLIYFQPKFNIATNTICGAEALVRWQHPTLGFLPPNMFIPLFESNGFIVDLDYYMFEQVCIYMRDLIRRGKTPFPISVNFSREHFKADGLPEKLKMAVEFYQIPPHLIEIEITESAFGGTDYHFSYILDQLRSLGFRLAMDDFGSGVSSLNLLSSMPFTVLKIDKDFFHSRTTTERERIVISNIIRMASELQMEVICEGVETKEQAQFLLSIGCNMAQGYLYSKPIPKEEFDATYFA
ncbi:MAG: EAL domain-containing protein [Lachnospiraceae bacterium]|nr:EAL domain-containing protein [Lachnospiraceae bacterium]